MKRRDQYDFSAKMLSVGYTGIALLLLLLFLKFALQPKKIQYVPLPDDNERNMLHDVHE